MLELLYYIHLDVNETKLQMIGMLAERFQLTQFKDWQFNCISAIVKGEDVLVLQPTGSGKSLCFHFPAVWLKKSAVVITPIVSLMSDQTCSLKVKGIKATFLGTAQCDKNITAKILSEEYEVIFVTPESFFENDGSPRYIFKQLLWKQQIGLIAVDEAHLVCSWSSFR